MKLSLNKKEGKIVSQVIHHWNNEGLIDDTTKKKA
jgi:SOS response regulatory protein OraA/RecX